MGHEPKTVVYLMYSANDTLLYVGISDSPWARFPHHQRHQLWFDEVARIDLERYPTRRDAEVRESALIAERAPTYNVMHHRGKRRAQISNEALAALGRKACRHGHPLTKENTGQGAHGGPFCRTCRLMTLVGVPPMSLPGLVGMEMIRRGLLRRVRWEHQEGRRVLAYRDEHGPLVIRQE